MADEQSRVEYLFEAGPEHNAYSRTGVEEPAQTRYWWRKRNISEQNPVTVDELMTALGSVMPNAGRQNSLQALLNNMSDSVPVQIPGKGPLDQTVNVIGQKDNQGNIHEISPSDVETMITVLTLVHDAGIDYSVVNSGNGVALRLNDNSGATITLVDPAHPYLTGQVSMREGMHWRPALGRVTYREPGEPETGDAKHALAAFVDENGVEASPFTENKKQGTKSFRVNDTRVEAMKMYSAASSQFTPDLEQSKAVSLARYTGLDQATKNKLATAGIVNLVGIQKGALSKQMQAELPDAKIEQIYRLGSGYNQAYQAQINLGTTTANIAPVISLSDNGDGNTGTIVNDVAVKNIELDMRSAFLGDDRVDMANTKPAADPYQVSAEDAPEIINVAYRDARINYLKMLMGPDRTGIDRGEATAQAQFKHALANDPIEMILSESGSGLQKERRPMLNPDSQAVVLREFSRGILLSNADKNGVDDFELDNARKRVVADLSGKGSQTERVRRLEAFDALVQQFNDTFGTAPITGSSLSDKHMDWTPTEYAKQYAESIRYDDSVNVNAELKQVNQINDMLAKIVLDYKDETMADTPDLDDELLKSIVQSLPYDEQLSRLDLISNEAVRDAAKQQFINTHDVLLENRPLGQSLNLTRVIDNTQEGVNSTLYGFMMAQAVSKTPYAKQVVGDNSYASDMVQERAVQFDSPDAKRLASYLDSIKNGDRVQAEDTQVKPEFEQTTALSIKELRALDADPNSDEAKLQQYLADVKSGKKQFSWDPAVNPNPAAFNRDGTKLIRDVSPNEFKARALETVKAHLEKRGVVVGDDDVKIDAQGIVHFDAKIPLYSPLSHEQHRGGLKFKEYDGNPSTHDSHGISVSNATGRAYTDKAGADELSYQPIEGSIGQIFAPDHDGLIRTHYNRFNGQDIEDGQLTFQARYRGWFLNPDRDASGNWDKDMFRREQKNGLGHFNRLRVSGYDQSLYREVGQAVDSLISTRNVGDVTRFNSRTIMNKLLHGEALGDRVEDAALNKPVNEMSQAIRETELNAIRLEDVVGQSVKTTEIISYMKQFQKTLTDLKLTGGLTKPDDPQEVMLDVMQAMHSPVDVYGGHSVGEIANPANNLFVSDNMTGQGKMFGLLMYMVEGAEVTDDGVVYASAPHDANGDYTAFDADGKVVGVPTGTAIENTSFYDDGYKNAADRQPVSKEQGIKGHELVDGAHIATMALGALTMEDGLVVSKAFADAHQISDQTDPETGKPIYRSLKIGDKISDNGGNKATISAVIDPDMDLTKAESEGLLDVVALMKQNPDLDAVMNGMSQISRNNGATAFTYLTRDSSAPMTYRRPVKQADGSYSTDDGPIVPTNATINSGKLIITNQTINHKVKTYDQPGDDTGRKLSILLNNADKAKGAHLVANWHLRSGESLKTLRSLMLAMGTDISAESVAKADFDAVARETSRVEYKMSDEMANTIASKWKTMAEPTSSQGFARFNKLAVNYGAADGTIFDGVEKQDGENVLTDQSKLFLRGLETATNRLGTIASNREQLTNGRVDAGSDFLNQLPDGGVLSLPDGLEISTLDPQTKSNQIYVLPERLRVNTTAMDGTSVTSDFNLLYQNFGTNVAKYAALVELSKKNNLANGDEATQRLINQQIADDLNIQGSYDRIMAEADRLGFGGNAPKHGMFRNYVLGGYAKDSVTSQVSANPSLPMDVVEVSPAIAKRLGFVAGPDGMAHMKGHDDWEYLHVHRDPVWREQGSLAFRVKINPELTGVRISPVMAALMDADFDGDNLGLIAMPDAAVQKELRDKVSVDKWMLDNDGHSTLLNINAELVDMAVNTSNVFDVTGVNGNVISGNFNDPEFRGAVLENIRPDVLNVSDTDRQKYFDRESGQLLRDDTGRMLRFSADGQRVAYGDAGYDSAKSFVGQFNSGKFLTMMVDHEIKQHYDVGDYRGARQKVDEIVQRSRGFETTRDKNGEVGFVSGPVSMLQNDGVNYTNRDTFKASLVKYADEGAKGKRSAIDGLMEYIDKPLFSEVVQAGKDQFNPDGSVNSAKRQEFLDMDNGLHDTQEATQRATKIKSDMTGVPGSTQQKLTALLMSISDHDLHVANAIGQAGTQKILSIKRDPVMAGRVSEIMQGPLGDVMKGNFPDQSYPAFALVGPESQGRFGNDPKMAAWRATELRGIKGGRSNMTLSQYPFDIMQRDGDGNYINVSNEQLLGFANQLGMKIDTEKYPDQLDQFRQTVDEARQPYLNHQFMDDLAKKLGHPVPVLKDPDDNSNKPTPMAKDEFVEVMNFLYNDSDNGMDLGVDKANFERLADVLVDPNTKDDKYPVIRAVNDATKDGGQASLLAKINMQGYSAVLDEITRLEQPDAGPAEAPFGEVGSYTRESTMPLSNEEMATQFNLTERANELGADASADEREAFENAAVQDQMIAAASKEFAVDVRRTEVDPDAISKSHQAMGDLAATSQALTKSMADETKRVASSMPTASAGTVTTAKAAAKQISNDDTNTQSVDDFLLAESVIKGTYPSKVDLKLKASFPDLTVHTAEQFAVMQYAANLKKDNKLSADSRALMADNTFTGHDLLKSLNNDADKKLFADDPKFENMAKTYANGYIMQMKADDTVRKVLHDQKDHLSDFDIKPWQEAAINKALTYYDASVTKKSETIIKAPASESKANYAATPKSAPKAAVTTSKTSGYNQLRDIVNGDYRAPVDFGGTMGNTVNAQVSLKFANDNRGTISPETMNALAAADATPSAYGKDGATFKALFKQANVESKSVTGKNVMDPQSYLDQLTKAYHEQLVTNPTVREALTKDTQKALRLADTGTRSKAIQKAVGQYQREQMAAKQAQQQQPANVGAKSRDDGLSR